MAAHAIKAGEGDVFVAAGVETVSRFLIGMADSGPAQPAVRRRPRPARQERATGGAPEWTPPPGLPDIYIAMGQTAENVRQAENVGREEMDEFAAPSPAAGGAPPGERLLGAARSRRSPRRRHGRHQGRRPPRRHHRREAGRAQAGVPPRRRGHRRQRLPAQRRRRRRDRHERHQGPRAGHHPARPHRVLAACPASTPRSWASARSRRAARRWAGPA